ncbi:MAG: TraR/DksA C4-type zinc finger protein [Planctomycetia bacterium]|nr:TraR/DksA C4-type zinc finger protein [Planctomycetia bacterium]
MTFRINKQNEFRCLSCPDCGWHDELDTEKIYRWLVRIQKIREGREVEDEILYELFHGLSSQFVCPKCGQGGLRLEVKIDDFSDLDVRRCRGCAQEIPSARLQFFPETVYCTSCAEKLENGEPLPINAEFCPICGGMMELVPQRNQNGKLEFIWCCTKIPSCKWR